MQIELDVALDPTLGCGQAHRWKKEDGVWKGVIGNNVITLTQTENGFEFEGCDRDLLLDYFRHGDDLSSIINEISGKDDFVADLALKCPGLRILKQDPWECTATYILATNANVKRIGKMVESVCSTFGTDLGEAYSFPSPGQILDKSDCIEDCRLGYRTERFLGFARMVDEGEFDLKELMKADYGGCVTELKKVPGVGPKVADCTALFAFGHLESFPVDVRISKIMKEVYGVEGNNEKIAEAGRRMFGRYAGYAQELLYHSGEIPS